MRIEHFTEGSRVAVVGWQRCHTLRRVDTKTTEPENGHHLRNDGECDEPAKPCIAREAAFNFLDVDVEHHDDEQKEHHHRADINEHQHDGEELRFDQQPKCGARKEGEHERQSRIDGVARDDHPERCRDEDGRESVEKQLNQHPVVSRLAIARVGGFVRIDQRGIALTHGEQLVFGHDVLATIFHVVLVNARLDDGIDRTGLFAETAVDALE